MEDAASVEEVASLGLHGAEEELLPCPICFKTCNSRLELDAHMDTHPDTALRYTHTLSKIQMKMKRVIEAPPPPASLLGQHTIHPEKDSLSS